MIEMYRIVADFGNYDVVEESGIDLINITKQSCNIPYDEECTLDTPEDHREEDHESDWKDTLEFAFLLIFFMIGVPLSFFLHWLFIGY